MKTIFILLFLASCGSLPSTFNKIHYGMKKDKVLKLLGQPKWTTILSKAKTVMSFECVGGPDKDIFFNNYTDRVIRIDNDIAGYVESQRGLATAIGNMGNLINRQIDDSVKRQDINRIGVIPMDFRPMDQRGN